MRILYVLNSPGGGATQGIVELLRGLPAGYTPLLVTPRAPTAQQQAQLAPLAAEIHVVPLVSWNRKTTIPLYWRGPLWGREMVRSLFHLRPVRSLAHLIRSRQIDLVHTGTALNLEGALAARLCGVPHVWHVKEGIGQGGRVQFLLPDPLLVRFMASLSQRILVMSRFVGDIFVRHGQVDKLEVVPDGVDVQHFRQEANGRLLRQRLGIRDDEIVVGMAASLTSTWKQHELFLHMAALLQDDFPQARFVAFGPEPAESHHPIYNRPWHYYQALRRLAAELGLAERLIWAGFHDDIMQMMQAMDLLVHPCAYEPFGRVAIEAMAAGRPVVGPHSGGIAESVVDGGTGLLVPPHDAAALATAVAQLLRDPEQRQRLGAAGREHVARHFSLARHVQQIEQIYQAVVMPAGTVQQPGLLPGGPR